MRPGMFARVTLITSQDRNALVLPEEALVPQGTEQFVYRIEDSKAVRVKVETGQRRDGKVEILNGLEKGDVVVTAGQFKLREGTLVRTHRRRRERQSCRHRPQKARAGRRPRRLRSPEQAR